MSITLNGLHQQRTETAQPAGDEVSASLPLPGAFPAEEVPEIPELKTSAATEPVKQVPTTAQSEDLKPPVPTPQEVAMDDSKTSLVVSSDPELQVLHQQFSEAFGRWQADYATAMEEAGISRLLNPDRVLQDTTFAESRDLLKNMQKVIPAHRKQTELLLTNIRARIEETTMDASRRLKLESRCTALQERLRPMLDEMWANLKADTQRGMALKTQLME